MAIIMEIAIFIVPTDIYSMVYSKFHSKLLVVKIAVHEHVPYRLCVARDPEW